MLQTSPQEKKSIKDLAAEISTIGEATWTFIEPPEKLRWLFSYTVLGKHLHCYYCDRCGFMPSMKADPSFLEAMLSASEPADAKETQEQEE